MTATLAVLNPVSLHVAGILPLAHIVIMNDIYSAVYLLVSGSVTVYLRHLRQHWHLVLVCDILLLIAGMYALVRPRLIR